MRQQAHGVPAVEVSEDSERTQAAWIMALAAARHADQVAAANEPAVFAPCANGDLRVRSAGDPEALIAWRPGTGWEALLPESDPRRGLLDLYLPICSATPASPIIVGHLGQSLDGFIATHSGDSQFVTGPANIVHLHRMRALCQAVVVGAGTVAADNPQLNTRHVEGPNPLRVIFDPSRGLTSDYGVFKDDLAPTLYVCAKSLVRDGETHVGGATIVGLDTPAECADLTTLVQALRARGCSRIFVEGGGVTVSAFLEANLLDRLHVAVAPLLIGNGRPAIRLPARTALRDCLRPAARVFTMGGDVLFDCDLRGETPASDDPQPPTITRVI